MAYGVGELGDLDSVLLGIEDSLRLRSSRASQPGGWRYIPWLVRELIVAATLEAWDALTPEARRRAAECHSEFFNRVCQRYAQTSTYTLNYDPLIFECTNIPTRINTGFVDSGEFAPQVFCDAPSKMAFIHGNVGFVPGRTARFDPNYSQAQQSRVEAIANNYFSGAVGMKGLHANSLLVTGLDKFGHFALNPYAAYLHCLGRDLHDADVVVVIGVSFGEDHINAFLANLPLERPRQRLIIVDKKSPDEIDRFALREDDFLLTALSTTGDFLMTFGDDHWRCLASEVRRDGFGALSKQTTFFANGTEDFYRTAFAKQLL
jgi:hypothetical protein